MGLFRKKQKPPKEVNPPQKKILVVTTDDIPGQRFVPLGLITAETSRPASPNFSYVASHLIAEARKIDADAIIGFRAFALSMPATKWTAQSAYGTAVKFIDDDEKPQLDESEITEIAVSDESAGKA